MAAGGGSVELVLVGECRLVNRQATELETGQSREGTEVRVENEEFGLDEENHQVARLKAR